ncbi:paraquat-inducible protein A [Mucilaginibacter daejeonensis]|uniref:paraquat-inducible protein A n=1 Tax=Mucilaginibacter daejeonensis TaxID=398049 RepID=UPI001D1740C8|nr:paraquat-inducible protein A [Mucilaginibacter daejeonensis]UEG51939.1 paraquat-inducible protein A [Mucilaginibacter daejeonensis]
MRPTILNIILIIGLSILLCAEAYFGYHVYHSSIEQEHINEDYSLSNNVTFGLFSIDQWRDRIAAVVDRKISDFHLTRQQKRDIQKAVEKQLHAVVASTVAEVNKPQKSLGGKLKKLAFNIIVDSADVQAQVKPFAQTIVARISSPTTQKRLKGIAASKIDQLEQQTYDSTSVANYKVTKYVYQKYHVSDPITFNQRIKERLKSVHQETVMSAYKMVGCVVLALILWWIMRKRVQLQTVLFIMSLLFAAVMLAVGLTASVIEVDARISSFHFTLLGDKVEFINQVLFYQSKSIWQIITTLIGQQKPDAITIGILILLFVIILPLIRLLAIGIHVLGRDSIAERSAVRYLAFESGKWDMADVMIVGLLMTFIGLNGILKSQLSGLNMNTGTLHVETVNNSSLQPGYYIFVGYVVFSVLLSYILRKLDAKQDKDKAAATERSAPDADPAVQG